ncbi:MAG: PDZ domain-containing protein [Proteobacteria bacterium]|nr:PDZ domain-containing protein [Pseudomonadota bacterium]
MSTSTRRTLVILALGIALGAGVMAILFRVLGGGPGGAGSAGPDGGAAITAASAADGSVAGAGARRPFEGDCLYSGSVHDEGGAPIEGAIVRLRFLDEPGATAELPLSAATGADGRFSFPGVDRDGAYQIWAWAEGRAVGSLESTPCGAAADIALEPGGGLKLRFEGPDGGPFGPVEVQLAGSGLWPAREARTADDGRLEIVGLAPGLYLVRARSADGTLAYVAEEPISVEVGPSAEVVLGLAASAPAKLRVLDAGTGAPVGLAIATVGPATASMLQRVTRVDPKGGARIPGLLRPDHVVAAFAPGYVRSEPRSIGPGEEVTVRLLRGIEARGVVRTRDGVPVAGASIAAQLELGDARTAISGSRQHAFLEHVLAAAAGGWPRLVAGPRDGTALAGPPQIPVPDLPAPPLGGWRATDGNGRFAVDGLPAGRVILSASHPEFVTATAAILDLSTGVQPPDAEIVVQPGTTVSLRTLNEAGYPIRSARVSVYDRDEDLLVEAETGTDGFAELKGLPGAFRVVAIAEGRVPAGASIRGRPGERLEMSMTLPEAESTLRGRVTDERGYGVPDAAITARALGRNLMQVILGNTAGDGSFVLEGAGRGAYHVTAEVDGAIRAQVIGATAAEDVKLVLGEPIAAPAPAGDDLVIEPLPAGPALVEPGSFGGEQYAGAEPGDEESGDPLGVVAITHSEDAPAQGAATEGTSYSPEFGQTDQLLVTGSPSGPGGLPVKLGTGPSGGVIVKMVQPGSQVAGAGLAVGDRLVAVDGTPVQSVAQAKAAIQGRLGTVVMLEVIHQGEHLNVVVQRVRVSQ